MALKIWILLLILVISGLLDASSAPAAAAQQNDLDCTAFSTFDEANAYIAANPAAAVAIDDDQDGTACEVYFGIERRNNRADRAAKDAAASAPDNVVEQAQSTQDDRDCEAFATQEDAQAVLDQDPSDPNNLDPNGDGVACALLPAAADLQSTSDGGDGSTSATDDRAQRREERQQENNQEDTAGQPTEITCAGFATAEEAQAAFDADPAGLAALDADGNGVACEELPSADAGNQEKQNTRKNRKNQEDAPGTNTAIDEPATARPKEDLDCVDFAFQEEAQAVYNNDPSDPFNLDPNGDGFACSSLPAQNPQISQVPRTGAGTPAAHDAGITLLIVFGGLLAGATGLLRGRDRASAAFASVSKR